MARDLSVMVIPAIHYNKKVPSYRDFFIFITIRAKKPWYSVLGYSKLKVI
jgi:hypothetical protein